MEVWKSFLNVTVLNAMDKYARDNFSDSFINMVWANAIEPFKDKSREFNRFIIATQEDLFNIVCKAFCNGMFEQNIAEEAKSLQDY